MVKTQDLRLRIPEELEIGIEKAAKRYFMSSQDYVRFALARAVREDIGEVDPQPEQEADRVAA